MGSLRGGINGRALKDHKTIYNLTHFLRFPLCTPKTRLRLQTSLQELAKDPCSVNVPLEAYPSLEAMHNHICVLRLPTPDQVSAADKLVKRCVSRFSSAQGPKAAHTVDGVTNHMEPMAPLTVRIVGLKNWIKGKTGHHQVSNLGAALHDPTGRYEIFRQGLIKEFLDAGMTVPFAFNQIPDPGYVSLISAKRILGDTPRTSPNPTLNSFYASTGRTRVVQFDAQELHEKYKNHVWIHNLELERLSICEMGKKDFIRDGEVICQGWREVAAISLPGFEESAQRRLPHEEGTTFTMKSPPRQVHIPLYLKESDRGRQASKAIKGTW